MATMLAAGIGIALSEQAARAILPASPEQIVCTADAMVEGTVTAARIVRCDTNMPGSTSCIAHLAISVAEVLPGSVPVIRAGSAIEGDVAIHNSAPIMIGNRPTHFDNDGTGSVPVSETGRAITPAKLQAGYVGRDFYFTHVPAQGNASKLGMWRPDSFAPYLWNERCPRSAFRPNQG